MWPRGQRPARTVAPADLGSDGSSASSAARFVVRVSSSSGADEGRLIDGASCSSGPSDTFAQGKESINEGETAGPEAGDVSSRSGGRCVIPNTASSVSTGAISIAAGTISCSDARSVFRSGSTSPCRAVFVGGAAAGAGSTVAAFPIRTAAAIVTPTAIGSSTSDSVGVPPRSSKKWASSAGSSAQPLPPNEMTRFGPSRLVRLTDALPRARTRAEPRA